MPYRSGPLSPPAVPQRSRRLGAVLLALAFAAGGGAYYLRRAKPVVRIAPVVVSTEPVDFRCLSVRLADEHDGVADVLCGAVRESLTPAGEPTVGVERLDANIMSATPVASGWVFVTATGMVARSDTFTGRLHRLGSIPCDVGENPRSRGRVAIVDRAGTLWTTDGVRPVAAAVLPEKAHSAAFADATHGAVALAHGALLLTSDGGTTWSRVDLGLDVATSVAPVGDGIVVNTTAGTKRVTPDGLRPFRMSFVESGWNPYEGPTPTIEAAARRATESLLPTAHEQRCSPPPEPGSDAEDETLPPTYDCHVAGHDREPRTRLHGAPTGERVETTYAATSGFAEFAAWRTTDRQLRVAAYWTGVDTAGRFTGTAGPLVTGLDMTPGLDDLDWEMDDDVVAEGITRGGMLCSSEALGNTLLWAAPGRPIVALGRTSAEGLGAEGDTERLAVPLPDGGLALLYSSEIDGRGVGVALEISAAGAVVHARAFIADLRGYEGVDAALARWNDSLGIVRPGDGPGSARAFFPLDGSSVVAFPEVTPRAVEACAGPATPGAITLWSAGGPLTPAPATSADAMDEDGVSFGSVRMTEYEVANGRECVRSLVLLWGGLYDDRGGEGTPALMRPRPGRRYEGTLNDLGQRRVTCRPGEPRPPRSAYPETTDPAEVCTGGAACPTGGN